MFSQMQMSIVRGKFAIAEEVEVKLKTTANAVSTKIKKKRKKFLDRYSNLIYLPTAPSISVLEIYI